jgi:hypothetical protein
MAWILGALDRIPKMLGDKFQEQAFRDRPGHGCAGGKQAPVFKLTEV